MQKSINHSDDSSMRISKQHFRIILSAAFLLLLCACIAAPASAAENNFITMYVVGSDLEGSYGYASENLLDLADSMQSSAGDLILCYGGADKIGWDDGVTVTNLYLLKKDAEDGIIGVDKETGKPTEYILTRFEGIDISTTDALAESVTYADEYGAEHGLSDANRYIIFWDHGGAWSGYGKNSITGNMFTNRQINEALDSADKYDMIIFNACLMASLEVANELRTHADYMLASEEVTPAIQGINYKEAFSALSEKPSMNPVEFAGVIAGTYLFKDVGMHFPKVYSLVDLHKVPAVISALSQFGTELNASLEDEDSISVLGSAHAYTQKFGLYSGGGPASDKSVSEDLYEFVSLICGNTYEGALHTSAENLLAAINDYIVFVENNRGFRSTNGVSIMSSETFNNFMSQVDGDISIVPESFQQILMFGGDNGWDTYRLNYADALLHDNQSITAELEDGNLSNVTVTGSAGATQATIHYLYDDGTDYIDIGEIPLEENLIESDSNLWKSVPTGKYMFPEWDNSWFVLGNKGDNDGMMISLRYFNSGTSGQYTHYMNGNLTRVINGESVTHPSMIMLITDAESLEVYSVVVQSVPETTDSSSPVAVNLWGSTDILPGDVFEPTLFVYDTETDKISKTKVSEQSFTFGEKPMENFVLKAFDPEKCFWYFEAEDMMDMSSYYISSPDIPEPVSTPAPVFAVIAGAFAAFVLLRRK